MEYLPERLPELRVEDGVDDGVQERVDVAQPRRQDEYGDSRGIRKTKFRAHRVEDWAGEEWSPAEEEYTWKIINIFNKLLLMRNTGYNLSSLLEVYLA